MISISEHDMVYGDVKDLARRAASEKILRDKALLKIRNMMDITEVLLQWSINFLIKKLLAIVLKMRIFQTKS